MPDTLKRHLVGSSGVCGGASVELSEHVLINIRTGVDKRKDLYILRLERNRDDTQLDGE